MLGNGRFGRGGGNGLPNRPKSLIPKIYFLIYLHCIVLGAMFVPSFKQHTP